CIKFGLSSRENEQDSVTICRSSFGTSDRIKDISGLRKPFPTRNIICSRQLCPRKGSWPVINSYTTMPNA
ncbi:unnamed protein product, partial [Rodentolepis nana]|uniref:Uncharacterized protein n=1 Tax=Rodentolepis nana TaxID=102285 RepID=A0A0R3T9P1_RODNA